MDRAVFVDRDGTLIKDQHYNFDPTTIELLPGVSSGLRMLREAGYKIAVITNQSGVARGLFSEAHVTRMHEALRDKLASYGAFIDAFYYCPHYKQGTVPQYAVECDCRKPKPGMLLRAATDLSIELAKSWVIGDIEDDVEAGQRAGCKTILIKPGDCDPSGGEHVHPTFVARDFSEAVALILAHLQDGTDG